MKCFCLWAAGFIAVAALFSVSGAAYASELWATTPVRSQPPSDNPVTDDQGTCATLKPAGTDASVEVIYADPEVDNSHDLITLKGQSANMYKNWLTTQHLTNLWMVDDTDTAGIAEAALNTDFDVDTTTVPVDQYGVYYCSFFNKIHIKILYNERMMIPSKFEPGSCVFQVIKTHEQMLFDANRKAMDVYVARLRNDLPGIVDQLEKGYSGRDSLSQRQEQQKSDIAQAVNLYISDTVAGKVRELASIINTPEELKLRTAAMKECAGKASAPAQ